MGRKFFSLKGKQGDASVLRSMILALGKGTKVGYNMSFSGTESDDPNSMP